jgi:Xaa-Pro dipeptidase
LIRIDRLREAAVKQNKPPNYAVFNQHNIIYFTNTSAATALLITENGANILYTSTVNYEQVKAEAENATVECLRRGENVLERIGKQVGSAPLCVDVLSIESWHALGKALESENRLESASQLIQDLRKVKDPQEISLIREACRIADIGMKTVQEVIRPGIKEKEVAAEAEYSMRKAGSDGVAFDTIVASGHCCAYPHGTFLEKTIVEGDLVVADLGATWRFYHSDITRTFVAGKSSEKQVKMFEAVRLAQQSAFKATAPNVWARDVDATARLVIAEAGYRDFFVHNLGHGVGLEVHEAPVLSSDSKDLLDVGNVVTIEPGVYLPGYGGVRVEDTVLVREDGAEKLTLTPYSLSL